MRFFGSLPSGWNRKWRSSSDPFEGGAFAQPVEKEGRTRISWLEKKYDTGGRGRGALPFTVNFAPIMFAARLRSYGSG